MAKREKPKQDDKKNTDDQEVEVDEANDTTAEEGSTEEAEDADEGEDEAPVKPAKEDDLQTAKVTKSQVTPAADKPQRGKSAADELSDHYLDSPQKFGIWIGGELHQFNKGKTRLTNKQKDACLEHNYVADNGAQVIKLAKLKK